MPKALLVLIAEFFLNKEKDMFMVRLSSSLTVNAFGLTGLAGDFAGYFIRSAIGLAVKKGSLGIDLGLDALKAGMAIPEFEKLAKAAHDKAIKRQYSEEEKRAIREEYLDIVDEFTRIAARRMPDAP